MALPERFLNSIFLFLFVSCSSPDKGNEHLASFNADSLVLENRNGILYRNNAPFSGNVYKLGNLHDTISSISYSKGREHGAWKQFYPNGQLAELRYFQDGQKIKTLMRWWPNGRKQFACIFKNGEYDGVLQEWEQSGQLVKQMHYKMGHEEGSQKIYYGNGKIKSNYVVRDGKRRGLLGTKNCVNVSDSVFKK